MMNFLTAMRYALAGVPVGLAGTADEFEGTPAWWIVVQGGLWWRVDTGTATQRLLEIADLSLGDYRAANWITPPNWGTLPHVSEQPDFPSEYLASATPTFDPLDPRGGTAPLPG